MGSLVGEPRKLERERRAAPGAVARCQQPAAELASGVGAGVEAEAVTAGLGGEAVAEDLLEVLGREAEAGVGGRERQVGSRRRPRGDEVLGRGRSSSSSSGGGRRLPT